MGTWGTGPFDNDAAADWAGALDALAPGERADEVRRVLQEALDPAEDRGDEVVAAAAVVAAALPDGPPLGDGYGPQQPVEGLTGDDAPTALGALDRVTSVGSEWHETWNEAGELDDALAALAPVRAALSPA